MINSNNENKFKGKGGVEPNESTALLHNKKEEKGLSSNRSAAAAQKTTQTPKHHRGQESAAADAGNAADSPDMKNAEEGKGPKMGEDPKTDVAEELDPKSFEDLIVLLDTIGKDEKIEIPCDKTILEKLQACFPKECGGSYAKFFAPACALVSLAYAQHRAQDLAGHTVPLIVTAGALRAFLVLESTTVQVRNLDRKMNLACRGIAETNRRLDKMDKKFDEKFDELAAMLRSLGAVGPGDGSIDSSGTATQSAGAD